MKQFLVTLSASGLAFILVLFGYWMINAWVDEPRHLERPAGTAEQMEDFLAANHLAQGMATASQLKYLVSEHWAMEGELPCRNDQLAFNAAFEDPVLESVTVTGCGELTLTYKDEPGIHGGRMILQAAEAAGLVGTQLQWDCWTPDFSGIEQFMPQCRYDARGS